MNWTADPTVGEILVRVRRKLGWEYTSGHEAASSHRVMVDMRARQP